MKKEEAKLLKNVAHSEKKYCGNCRYHNTYDYPDRVFCFVKFQRLDNPVVSALDCCSEWEFKPQECFCLDDTLKKNKKKS